MSIAAREISTDKARNGSAVLPKSPQKTARMLANEQQCLGSLNRPAKKATSTSRAEQQA